MTLGTISIPPVNSRLRSRIESNVAPEQDLAFSDLVRDAFTQTNTIGTVFSYLDSEGQFQEAAQGTPLDAESLPLRIRGTPFEDRPDLLADISTDEQFEVRKRFLEKQLASRERLEAAGGLGLALSLGAGILDPINLVPFGVGAMVKGRGVTRILTAAAQSGVAAVGGAAASEAVAQATQPFLTAEESIGSLAVSGILGTTIGVFGGMVSTHRLFRVADDMARITDPEDGFVHMTADGRTVVANEKVASELVRLSEEGKIVTRDDVAAVYEKHGTEVDPSTVSGRVSLDEEILLSEADIEVLRESMLDDADPEVAVTREVDALETASREKVQDDLAYARGVQERYDVEGC